jgi:hypothetical protein
VAANGIGPAIGTLEADDARIAADVTAGEYGNLHADCALLDSDLSTVASSPTSPDETLSQDMTAAFSDEAAAGRDCFGGSAANQAVLARSRTERIQAQANLESALARIGTLTGRVPSTATTVPGGG